MPIVANVHLIPFCMCATHHLIVPYLTAISSSFYRYQPFAEPLSAVRRAAISRSPNRYYLFEGGAINPNRSLAHKCIMTDFGYIA